MSMGLHYPGGDPDIGKSVVFEKNVLVQLLNQTITFDCLSIYITENAREKGKIMRFAFESRKIWYSSIYITCI